MIKNYLSYAVAAAFFVASAIGNVAFAQSESEAPGTTGANDSFAFAQRLEFDDKIEVTGTIGVPLRSMTPTLQDIDFYWFQGRADDTVTINIDAGIKPAGDARSLDSMIAIFKPDGTVLAQKNDVLPTEIDRPGSIAKFDPRIEKVRLPVNGKYIVGVTSDWTFADQSMRVFLDQGGTTSFGTNPTNGTYLLIIQKVSPPVLQISIDIKPGANSIAPLNLKSKGKIPVALLSSEKFDARKVDRDSLRFGPPNGAGTGGRCDMNGEYVDEDNLLDLVCHFDTQDAHLDPSNPEAMVRGTIEGRRFEGKGWLKIVPVKRPD